MPAPNWSKQESEARQAEIERMYFEDGLSLRSIADKFGVSRQSVHERLKSRGLKLRKRTRYVRPDISLEVAARIDVKLLCQRYVEDKENLKTVGKEFGLTVHLVSRILSNQGVKIRPRSFPRSPFWDSVRDLQPNGFTDIKLDNPATAHVRCYAAVRHHGFKVSVKWIAPDTYRVTRRS